MTERKLVMPAKDRESFLQRLVLTLTSLPEGMWDLTLAPRKVRRSIDQNALLWALYGNILEQAEGILDGWDKSDLHEYLLGEHFGWETIEGFGRKRLKPLRRSSRLSMTEFSEFLDFIVRRMAGHGIVLQMPGDLAA